jgi:uncharacterized protein with beta-barrel porin domain
LEAGSGSGFVTHIRGGNGRDSLLVNAGFNFEITPTVSFSTYYTGELGRGGNADLHAVNGGIRWEF